MMNLAEKRFGFHGSAVGIKNSVFLTYPSYSRKSILGRKPKNYTQVL
jgi:hypothetical protein|tara:strand:- start:66 stop:206 length:141 start_codon:yes stop_codon:yes gene_type:complete